MCSLVILYRPGDPWPLILAANRDEMGGRPWKPPARHWPERPEVVAGLDELAGGSWMGLNDHGLVACVLNRIGTLGPAKGKRSRGELVLEALDHAEASQAAEALAALNPAAYRPFNLVIADMDGAYWLRHADETAEEIETIALAQGLSMLTAHDLNDPGSPRIARYLPRFREAMPPRPDADDWESWAALLAERDEADPYAGMEVYGESGFGTVSSSILALPGRPRSLVEPSRQPVWRFAPGPPSKTAYAPLQV